MVSPRLTPDRAIVGRLVTQARRLAQEQGDMALAADELWDVSEHRIDLLTEAARTILHNFYVEDALSSHPTNLLAAGLLVVAGADAEAIRESRT